MPALSRRDFLILSAGAAANVAWARMYPWKTRSEAIRVALVGHNLSTAAVNHFAQAPGVELGAVLGIEDSVRIAHQFLHAVPLYKNAESLARDITADVIIILVPDGAQPGLLQSLRERRIATLLETPVSAAVDAGSQKNQYVQFLPRRILTMSGIHACVVPSRELHSVEIQHSFVRHAATTDSPISLLMGEVGDAVTYSMELLQVEELDSCHVAYSSRRDGATSAMSMIFRFRDGGRAKPLIVNLRWRQELSAARGTLGFTQLTARGPDNALIAHCVPRSPEMTSLCVQNAVFTFDRAQPKELLHPLALAHAARSLIGSAVEQMNDSAKYALCGRA